MAKKGENGADLLEAPKKNGKATEAKSEVARKVLSLPELDFRQMTLKVVGMSPLIMNKFSQKMIGAMLDKQMKKASKGREAKDPDQMYKDSLYLFPDGKKVGFPAVGFKAAMVRAGKLLGMAMTDTRGKFHVLADPTGNGLIEIKGEHRMRTDTVRLATGVADIRFRAEFPEWSSEITIMYNATWISQEQIAQLLTAAGFSCGIGEWRPEKSSSGSFGLFKLASE
jgi:hypothetical protein